MYLLKDFFQRLKKVRDFEDIVYFFVRTYYLVCKHHQLHIHIVYYLRMVDLKVHQAKCLQTLHNFFKNAGLDFRLPV